MTVNVIFSCDVLRMSNLNLIFFCNLTTEQNCVVLCLRIRTESCMKQFFECGKFCNSLVGMFSKCQIKSVAGIRKRTNLVFNVWNYFMSENILSEAWQLDWPCAETWTWLIWAHITKSQITAHQHTVRTTNPPPKLNQNTMLAIFFEDANYLE